MRHVPSSRAARVLAWMAACLALAGFLVRGASRAPSLAIDAEAKTFASLPPDSEHVISFAVTNRTSLPIKFVGSEETCTIKGCLKGPKLPLEIRGGEKYDLPLVVTTKAEGPYQQEIKFFTDCPDRGILVLKVHGMVSRDGLP